MQAAVGGLDEMSRGGRQSAEPIAGESRFVKKKEGKGTLLAFVHCFAVDYDEKRADYNVYIYFRVW